MVKSDLELVSRLDFQVDFLLPLLQQSKWRDDQRPARLLDCRLVSLPFRAGFRRRPVSKHECDALDGLP